MSVFVDVQSGAATASSHGSSVPPGPIGTSVKVQSTEAPKKWRLAASASPGSAATATSGTAGSTPASAATALPSVAGTPKYITPAARQAAATPPTTAAPPQAVAPAAPPPGVAPSTGTDTSRVIVDPDAHPTIATGRLDAYKYIYAKIHDLQVGRCRTGTQSIVDVGGSINGVMEAMNKNSRFYAVSPLRVHVQCPVASGDDLLRVQAIPKDDASYAHDVFAVRGDRNITGCHHLARDCSCVAHNAIFLPRYRPGSDTAPTGRHYVMVHSFYHLSDADFGNCEPGDQLWVAVHRFDGDSGEFGGGEFKWSASGLGRNRRITMLPSAEHKRGYSHPDTTSRLEGFAFKNARGASLRAYGECVHRVPAADTYVYRYVVSSNLSLPVGPTSARVERVVPAPPPLRPVVASPPPAVPSPPLAAVTAPVVDTELEALDREIMVQLSSLPLNPKSLTGKHATDVARRITVIAKTLQIDRSIVLERAFDKLPQLARDHADTANAVDEFAFHLESALSPPPAEATQFTTVYNGFALVMVLTLLALVAYDYSWAYDVVCPSGIPDHSDCYTQLHYNYWKIFQFSSFAATALAVLVWGFGAVLAKQDDNVRRVVGSPTITLYGHATLACAMSSLIFVRDAPEYKGVENLVLGAGLIVWCLALAVWRVALKHLAARNVRC